MTTKSGTFTDGYPFSGAIIGRYRTWYLTGGDRPAIAKPTFSGKPPKKRIIQYMGPTDDDGQSRKMAVAISQSWRSLNSQPSVDVSDGPHAYIGSRERRDIDVYEQQSGGCTIDAYNAGYRVPITQIVSPLIAANVTSWDPKLNTAADALNLLSKLREKTFDGEFNLAVFLGEGRQCLDMITDAAVKMVKSYKHLKKGDISGAARILVEGTNRKVIPHKGRPEIKLPNASGVGWAAKEMADRVLEVQYGWKPLYSDVHAAAKQLAYRLNSTKRQKYVARSQRTITKEVRQTIGSSTPPANEYSWWYEYHYFIVQSNRKQAILYLDEKPSVPAVLGLLDPELVVWEKLPWSFVFDWFIPIGDYLSTRAAFSHLEGTVILTDCGQAWATAPAKLQGNGWFQAKTLQSYPSFRSYMAINRQLPVTAKSLSVPLPRFKGLSEVPSFNRAVNAIALITQQVLKR